MMLSSTDSQRFYQIWWPLLNYVNTQHQVVNNFPIDPSMGGMKIKDSLKIRNVLWNSPDLLDKFISSNPAGLQEADLALAASWKHRFSSKFVILRHLKKHSVFLSYEEQAMAFGVIGILCPIQDVVGHYLPVMVEAVLLPFEGKIIYDGIIAPYQVSFGTGLRNRFNHAYRTASELNGVKTSLNLDDVICEVKMDAVAKGNQKILLAFRKDLAASGLGERKLEEHYSVVENFVRSHLLQSIPPRSLLKIQVDDLAGFFNSSEHKANRISFKRLVRFLYNSERIDAETAKDLEIYLKSL